MLNLAMDTATHWGRFALAEDDQVLVYRPLNIQGSYADALLPVITGMLAETGHGLQDISGIGITRGPGSFTGVRIGVATAKALAYALGCELVAVSTLDAMAAALLLGHPGTEYAVPVLDARRKEVFAGVYSRKGRWVQPLAAGQAGSSDHWWGIITETLTHPEKPAYGGDGSPLLLGQGETMRPELKEGLEPSLRPWSTAHPRTAEALALAMGAGPEVLPRIHPFALTPLYMRVSDAEIKRHLDLTPQAPVPGVPFHDGGGLSA